MKLPLVLYDFAKGSIFVDLQLWEQRNYWKFLSHWVISTIMIKIYNVFFYIFRCVSVWFFFPLLRRRIGSCFCWHVDLELGVKPNSKYLMDSSKHESLLEWLCSILSCIHTSWKYSQGTVRCLINIHWMSKQTLSCRKKNAGKANKPEFLLFGNTHKHSNVKSQCERCHTVICNCYYLPNSEI